MECPKCGNRFELLRAVDDLEVKCWECGETVKKLISVVNHTFGWRLTERAHERFGPKEEVERNV